MPTLTDNNPTIAHKPPEALPETYAAELGPYTKSYDVGIIAYVTHFDGGDESTASMRLLFDGAVIGEKSDRSFHRADLEVRYDFFLSKGSIASLAIATEHHRATVGKHGFRLEWTEKASD